jgi:TonB-dependent SusC/RagA subfamily outer membrane receptor
MLQGVSFEGRSDLQTGNDQGTKITIRGKSGPFTAETQPLYILDGEELDPLKFKTIDPNTIASVNVLKGESATKIYGAKGTNGVVVINSKNK